MFNLIIREEQERQKLILDVLSHGKKTYHCKQCNKKITIELAEHTKGTCRKCYLMKGWTYALI